MLTFIFAFAIYTLLVLGVGVWANNRANAGEEEYFLAGRRLGPWVAALSSSASSESGWVTLGLVGWAFSAGVRAFWIVPAVIVGFAVNWFVIAGRLRGYSQSLGALTIPDFLAKRFGTTRQAIRVFAVIVILIAMTLYVAAQFAAAGKAFSAAFEGLDYLWGVVIGAGLVLTYVSMGGFRAACWTDLLQGLLMVAVLVLFPFWLMLTGHGPHFIRAGLSASVESNSLIAFWPALTGSAFIGFLLGSGALGVGFGYMGQPHVLVRFMAMQDRRDAVMCGFVSIVWAVLVISGAITMGLIARAFAEQGVWWAEPMLTAGPGGTIDGEYALILAAEAMLPPALGGLTLAAILAAIASTADSQLVVGASAVASDFIDRVLGRGPRGGSPVIHRLCVLGVGLVAVALVLDEQVQIFSFVLTYGWAILGASFGPQVLLALFWRRATGAGCIAGMATGFVVAIGWKLLYTGDVEIYNLPVAFVAATVVNVLVSRIVPMSLEDQMRT
ncbi:MAG: sodium/proline symporter [Phycisphaerales bacterium]|nr:sodium/proline symporter [Phycisphaerales bacterium]